MKGYGKIIAIVAVILLVGIVGIGFALRSIYQDMAGSKPSASAPQTNVAPSFQPASNDKPPDHPQGDGTIVYRMHREAFGNTTDSLIQGTFTLHPGPVEQVLTLSGTGDVQFKTTYAKDGTTYTCKGTNEIHGTGGMGMLDISGDPVGNCVWDIQGKVMQHPNNASEGFTCSFSNVDTVNGGSYEVQAEGEDAQWGKCELELKPK